MKLMIAMACALPLLLLRTAETTAASRSGSGDAVPPAVLAGEFPQSHGSPDGSAGTGNHRGFNVSDAKLRASFEQLYVPSPECRQNGIEWQKLVECKNQWMRAYAEYVRNRSRNNQ